MYHVKRNKRPEKLQSKSGVESMGDIFVQSTGQTPTCVFLPAAVSGILTGDSPMTMFLMQPVKPRRERTPRTLCSGRSCPPMYSAERVSVDEYAPRPGFEK